jgi:hypothetical protein
MNKVVYAHLPGSTPVDRLRLCRGDGWDVSGSPRPSDASGTYLASREVEEGHFMEVMRRLGQVMGTSRVRVVVDLGTKIASEIQVEICAPTEVLGLEKISGSSGG